ncbi:hypothetical protein FALBO_12681 [Fusarium albosuccineum]|uniref:Uncharacterized protein n=1 Tax=Fusarium albosuccineum TaxID=1237068 RepID=A0A8H4L084_9HYPO|nr:hypothetical protein FALBO_12681 [Fusarium albosuccineum]
MVVCFFCPASSRPDHRRRLWVAFFGSIVISISALSDFSAPRPSPLSVLEPWSAPAPPFSTVYHHYRPGRLHSPVPDLAPEPLGHAGDLNASLPSVSIPSSLDSILVFNFTLNSSRAFTFGSSPSLPACLFRPAPS